ncbi:MAG: hypothetical protein HY017_04065 [Betaproteobacteria bacterium]|nr:hypothetical protein [Betaproteobacteria bacterium]
MNLKPEDAALLIGQTRSENTVLIGGQAVAFWIRYFNIQAQLPALTDDIDYLGTRAEAKRVSARLKVSHTLKIATIDDNAPNSALLSVNLKGYPEPVLIDYLASIIGVESKAVQESAVVVEFQGEPLRVLHPLQLLQTKIWNLYRLDVKRTPEGIEQARLAIEVAAAFIERANMPQRYLLDAIEAVGRFAPTLPARFALEQYGLDCLKAVPASVLRNGILPKDFRKKRWPQILARAGRT